MSDRCSLKIEELAVINLMLMVFNSGALVNTADLSTFSAPDLFSLANSQLGNGVQLPSDGSFLTCGQLGSVWKFASLEATSAVRTGLNLLDGLGSDIFCGVVDPVSGRVVFSGVKTPGFRAVTSTLNGTSFTLADLPASIDGMLPNRTSMASNGLGRVVIAGRDASSPFTGFTSHSDDGGLTRGGPATSGLHAKAVAYGGGTWMTAGLFRDVHTSATGTSWTPTTSIPGALIVETLNYGNGSFVALLGSGTTLYHTENDGSSWTSSAVTGASVELFNITHHDTYGWLVSDFVGALFQSTDFITWTPITTGLESFTDHLLFFNG